MKKETVIGKGKSAKTRSSMKISSETVCEDEACIGKSANAPSPSAHESDKVSEKPTKPSGTAMSFGGKQGCTDEACIGKT